MALLPLLSLFDDRPVAEQVAARLGWSKRDDEAAVLGRMSMAEAERMGSGSLAPSTTGWSFGESASRMANGAVAWTSDPLFRDLLFAAVAYDGVKAFDRRAAESAFDVKMQELPAEASELRSSPYEPADVRELLVAAHESNLTVADLAVTEELSARDGEGYGPEVGAFAGRLLAALEDRDGVLRPLALVELDDALRAALSFADYRRQVVEALGRPLAEVSLDEISEGVERESVMVALDTLAAAEPILRGRFSDVVAVVNDHVAAVREREAEKARRAAEEQARADQQARTAALANAAKSGPELLRKLQGTPAQARHAENIDSSDATSRSGGFTR